MPISQECASTRCSTTRASNSSRAASCSTPTPTSSMAIVDRRLRALASDTLGRATVSSTTPDAFKIAVVGGTLQIGKGRLYVDGLLAENHGAATPPTRPSACSTICSAETQFADPIQLCGPALPARRRLPLPTAGLTPGLPRRLGSRGHASRATRPGRERGRRRHHLRACRPSGRCACSTTTRRGTTCASPDADLPRLERDHRALHRRAHHRHLRRCSRGRSVRAAADRRLPRAREPALSRGNPRRRPARRRRHVQVVARERERRQPRREHGLGHRAGARDARSRRRAALQHRRLGRDHRRRARVLAGRRRDAAQSPSIEATRRIQFTPALPADDAAGKLPRQRVPTRP